MKKRIYTVATSHLDTIWSWDFETTVSKYIYNTLVENFALLKKYPNYVFSFEGSYRYELMEEYYPELFEELKEYIKDGRWNVTGSAFENGDVNTPSPEALFRNILIGNSYFDEKFEKRSCDIFLPDCFGFGWALPSIAHHAHLNGFTTQKLPWGCAYGNPFDIGKWYGVDGNYIYASLNPGSYNFSFSQLRDWDFVQNKLKENEKYGLDWTYVFHGIGDRGGSPREDTVKFTDGEIAKNGESDIEVLGASADKIYRDIEAELPDEVKDKLPEWKTELVMTNHGVGGYTSRAIGKRWNAKCQELADMAERFGVMSSFFGASDYNEEVIEKSWKRAIAHQFHDDTPGTSVQRAYRRSWNDYAMSINQLEGEIEASLSPLTQLMDSGFCAGVPVMVTNPVEVKRKSAVRIKLRKMDLPHVRVFDDTAHEVPSQIISDADGVKEILFIAEIEPFGMRVYDVRTSKQPPKVKSSIKIDDTRIENQKYIVTLNRAGNISSIIDKESGDTELLKKPVVLGLFNYTGSKEWPAWEMNFDEANKEPDRIPELISFKIVERGPARACFEVIQKDKKSEFKSYICLTEGCEYVEVYNEIEWQSMRTLAKHRFSFTAENEKATFDLGLGVIERENMTEKLFEVPAQKWADITDKSGEFGVSVLSECKHGWDKFDDSTLRLTALHTPKKNYRIDSMQSMMDLGLNLYSFAIFSHSGKVGAETQLQSKLFTYPLTAVTLKKHKGALGSNYSFGSISDSGVIVRCLKKKHHSDGDELIVRFNEGAGNEVNGFTFTLGEGIESACEVWASEEYKNDAVVEDGKIVCDFKPFEVKTFEFTLKKSEIRARKPVTTPQSINADAKTDYIPATLRRDEITVSGIKFRLGDKAMTADGQTLEVKEGKRLALLCTNFRDNEFVNNAYEAYARWDLYDFKETAYIKEGRLGYEFTHFLDENGKTQWAKGLYFWIKILDKTTSLPENDDIVILAVTEIEKTKSRLVTPLIDEIENNREFTFKKNFKEKLWYFTSKFVWNINDKDNFISHNNNGKNGKRIEQTGNRFETKKFELTDK